MHEIGCFVSSHGFGHATRLAAIIEAMSEKRVLQPHIFATTGAALFEQSLKRFTYHHLFSDIGFVQHNAFDIDITATCTELEKLLPYDQKVIDRVAGVCRNCSCIISDISAMGIKIAQKLSIPAVLVENFTWDFIYAPYFRKSNTLRQLTGHLEQLYAQVDIHIQTEPVCRPMETEFRCGPIARKIRSSRTAVKDRFDHGGRKIVLISLGGVPFYPQFIAELEHQSGFFFVITGQRHSRRIGENIQLVARSSSLYHPDLMNSADIAVFKCGYSTLAECYRAGTPAICIRREGFAESAALERFAQETMVAKLISEEDFSSGKWLALLPKTATRRRRPSTINGADQVADFLSSRVFME